MFRVAVVSDLHMYSQSDPGRAVARRVTPSYLCADHGQPLGSGDPVADLERLIDQEPNLRADLLLCPGDLGDIASETGIRAAWKRVQEIGRRLRATCVVGTPGNHDINLTGHEPEECLKTLAAYPVSDTTRRNEFWTDHFTVIDADSYRLVCLNSSAYHDTGDPERKYGRLGERTRKSLLESFKQLQRKPIQILLCHHHPHQHSEYQLGEHDVMKGGQLLLDLLSRFGNWLVVHGHKHHPKLTRAAGHNTAPWVLAAGSLAALPNPAVQGHARNQFYILEFDSSTFATLGWGGTGYAWDWATEDGWSPAGRDSGLPARFGFGYSGDLGLLARSMVPHVPPNAQSYADWLSVVTQVPVLNRMTPRDIDELMNHGFMIEFGDNGVPLQIARSE